MKKTSLFILLILLTFSLSQSNIKTHLQSYQGYIGINKCDKIFDFISEKMKLSKEIKEKIKPSLTDIEFNDRILRRENTFSSTPNKLREVKINSFNIEGELLQINNTYVLYFIYKYDVIVEKPPKYERKCKSGFLGIGKKCKNVEISQKFTQNELNEMNEEIRKRIIVDAFLDLPKEDKGQFKQILRFKFPENKNLKEIDLPNFLILN